MGIHAGIGSSRSGTHLTGANRTRLAGTGILVRRRTGGGPRCVRVFPGGGFSLGAIFTMAQMSRPPDREPSCRFLAAQSNSGEAKPEFRPDGKSRGGPSGQQRVVERWGIARGEGSDEDRVEGRGGQYCHGCSATAPSSRGASRRPGPREPRRLRGRPRPSTARTRRTRRPSLRSRPLPARRPRPGSGRPRTSPRTRTATTPETPHKCTWSDRDPDPPFSTPRRVASPLSATKHCEPRLQDDSNDKCTLRSARCSIVLSTPTILEDADLCLLILETKQIVI